MESLQHWQMHQSFFPTVHDASVLKCRRLSSEVTQILTGHSLLNAHQFRFGFKTSQTCMCGYFSENVHHFLFFCPNFSDLRNNLRVTCLSENERWPPSLAAVAKSTTIWTAFCQFVRKTSRLAFKSSEPTLIQLSHSSAIASPGVGCALSSAI